MHLVGFYIWVRLAVPQAPPNVDLVGNGPLLASTIDEEYFAFLSLIYIIFSVATLVCVELKYNTRSCPDSLLSL